MIRLLRTALLPIAPMRALLCLPFSNNKKKSWIKKDKVEKKNPSRESGSLNENVTDEAKQHFEQSQYQNAERQEKKRQKRAQPPRIMHVWQDIPSLIHTDWLEPLKNSFTAANKQDFQGEWSRINAIRDPNSKANAIFQFTATLMARLLEIKSPVSEQLAAAIMKGYFCFPPPLPPNHFMHDFIAAQFLTAHQPHLEIYFKKAPFMQQLRFYNYYKDLTVRRAGQPKFRQLTSYYYFIYKILQEEMGKVDFAGETGQEALAMMKNIINAYPLNSEDSRLIKNICSQVPFFSQGSLNRFLINNLELLLKADPATLLSIIQAAKLYGFSKLSIYMYESLVSVLVTLYGRVPELATEVQELLCMLLTISIPRVNRSYLYNMMIDLSKHIELQPNSPAAIALFDYLRDKIKLLAFIPNKDLQLEVKLRFQLLSCLLGNKLIRRSNFEAELKDLEQSLENVMSRRKEVDGKYLLRLLQRGNDKLEVFNGALLLQMSPKKKVEYIREVLQLDDLDFAKSLMHILVNTSKDPPLLTLKRMISEQDFQDILTKLNSCILKNGDPTFYKQVFQEMVDYDGFSSTSIEIIENIRKLPNQLKKGVQGQILESMLKGCVRKAYQRMGGFRRLLDEMMQVVGYYINTLQMADLLLAQPYFYMLMSLMMGHLRQTIVSEFKVNTYRMLVFLLDSDTPCFVELIEPAIRQFTLVNEDYDRLKNYINVQNMERKVINFMLEHHVSTEYLHRIQDKIARGDLKVSEAHNYRFNKIYTPTYIPDQVNKDSLVAFVMDQNVVELLKDYQQTVTKIVQEATLKELAFYIYNFSSHYKVVRSEIFEKFWLAFLKKLEPKNIPLILSGHILGKFPHIDQKLYMPFLYKVINFYGENPSYYTRYMHANLLVRLKYIYRNVTSYPSELHSYVKGFRKFLEKQLYYLSSIHRFGILVDLMQLGYSLTFKQFRAVKEKIFEHDFSFYYLIFQEYKLNQTFEKILSEYLRRRTSDLLPQVKIYIELKYPSLKSLAQTEKGGINNGVKKVNQKQLAALSRLQKRYKGLQLKRDLVCLTNAQHLIAFHPSDRPVMMFLQKLYTAEPSTRHLQTHIFDLSDLSQPADFYTRIETLGIVTSRNETYVQLEKIQESSEQKLQRRLKELQQQSQKGIDRFGGKHQ